jgi:hypothetical protein
LAGFCCQRPFCEKEKAVCVVAFKSFSEEKIHMQRFNNFFTIFLLLIFSISLSQSFHVQAQSETEIDFSQTIDYLSDQLLPDGGFPGLSEGSDPGTTARALLAFRAINLDPDQFVSSEGKTPIDYLLETYTGYISDDNQLLFPGNAGLILASLAIYEAYPAELPQLILDTLKEDGSFSTEASKDWNSGVATDLSQALAIIGLSSAGKQIPAIAVDYLVAKQMEDGTWDNGFGSDPDSTAIVVISLLSSGQVDSSDPVILKAIQYFRESQLENGGWRPLWDSTMMNVDTTGWITLALISAGEDLADWEVDGINPREALIPAIQSDGSIGTSFNNVFSTVEALLAFSDAPIFSPVVQIDSPLPTIQSKAGLAITLPDGSSVFRCVEFSGESISGYDLLASSGLVIDTSFNPSMGNAVCGIEGQGCSSDNCFCGMPNYWSYWQLDKDEWSYSAVGANTYEVTAGAVNGWSWGDQPPVPVNFDQICAETPLLYLPVVGNESIQLPTTAVLLPLVESAGDLQTVETAEPQQNNMQYFVFGFMIVGLVVILFFLLRKKRSV